MNICYVVMDDMLATSMTWPSEMWASAAQFAKSRQLKCGAIQTSLIAEQTQVVRTHAGLSMLPDLNFSIDSDDKPIFDLIYVPALWRNPYKVVARSADLITWLKFQHDNGAILCGVGTGVCLIAETGLLDHKAATTHWYFFDDFEKNYPLIDLKRQHFITTADPIYCAASINSLADLTVHFIQRFFGQTTAQHIERHFSHEIRRAYDRTSFMDKKNHNHPDESILQTQLWMQDNLIENITVQQLAKQSGMSIRNFARRFQTATDMTAKQYLQNIRIDHAQDLLQYSNLSIAEIAEKSGFNDLSYFAKTFKKQRLVSPSEYRKTVRAKLFNQNLVEG